MHLYGGVGDVIRSALEPILSTADCTLAPDDVGAMAPATRLPINSRREANLAATRCLRTIRGAAATVSLNYLLLSLLPRVRPGEPD